ncbi:2-oxo-tetronate isomerase [Noviherbaspirillum galbum]|uniref:Hydroxypyruvate isomerase family protein n=1 Tax=Noviherbaspirillum galbum TaxID=2709383 RepID=A0A6B3SS71_9BURK|nr:2-oxo-tetronate isomerase [Noviherbaspirillum galbum]NEX63534.1 hydroxypyruvate isomerase family protein [Noviherbaspirillum galbum]
MPKFAANLTMMFNEVPFLERFEAAASAGFGAVEFLFPYEHSAETIAGLLGRHGLRNVLFNMPPGDWAAGERGMACLPGREEEFRAGVAKAIHYALACGTPNLHMMAGLLPANADRAHHRAVYVDNLRHACEEAAKHGINVLIEPINTRDIPGYFLNLQSEAHAIREEVGSPNLKVQMDFYHVQIVEGDIAMKLKRYLPHVGHIQIAGVPDRNEPDVGEVNYPYLFDLLDSIGYGGWIGCEYRPAQGTVEGLGWLQPYLDPERKATGTAPC